MLTRRKTTALVAALPLLSLAECASTGGTVSLAQAQAYADDLIAALSVAADTYMQSPGAGQIALVFQIQSSIQQLKAAIDSVQSVTDARGIILQVIQFATQLTPLVSPFLGAAGAAIPLALAVLQAFVSALPAPNAPAQPPAALHRLALKYHPK